MSTDHRPPPPPPPPPLWTAAAFAPPRPPSWPRPKPNRGVAEWAPFRFLVWLWLINTLLVMLAGFLAVIYS